MAFLTLDCPNCHKFIIVDDDDEVSYCMHCAFRLDVPGEYEVDYMDPELEAYIRRGPMATSASDYSDDPWYQEAEESSDLLYNDDVEGYAEKLSDIIGRYPDSSEDIRNYVKFIVTGWIVDSIVNGEAYTYGMADIARVIMDYDGEEGPSSLSEELFYAICQVPQMVSETEDAAIVAESLFNILMEYPELQTDIRMVLEMCTDFMHASILLVDSAESCNDDDDIMDEVRSWIYKLQEFVKIFGNLIYNVTATIGDEDKLDEMADKWKELDISTIGANIAYVADRYLEGEIDEGEATKELQQYVDDYISV